MTDVLVVGSGPGAVHAAAALVAAGRRVVMLDYGNVDRHYAPLIPHRPFTELRRTDEAQHRYFLGDQFEGIPFGPVRVGAQLTPPRMYVMADTPVRQPVDAPGFAASMSLGRGGLGAAWSAGVFPFTDDELRDMGLGLDEMRPHYDAVAERVGVCGERDDVERFFPSSPSMMPPPDIDSSAEVVLARYLRRRQALQAVGFHLGRTRLAVATRPHRGRGPHDYLDLEYWADKDRSVYRAQFTVEELEREPGFTYAPRRLVESFAETADGVRVRAVHADTGAVEEHAARALVLGAGTFGTARIVLRSLDAFGRPVPLVCNAYAYVPTLNLGMLARPARDRRCSLAQLTALLAVPGTPGHLVQAQLFSYRSLLTFKLMKELPFAYREARRLLAVLMPKFAILGIHHEDRPHAGKACVLHRDPAGGPDRLEIRYAPTEAETRTQRADERTLLACFRRLGCLPLKTIRPGHGSSIHYAGTFRMTPAGDDLTCDTSGRLRATRAVYVADGSVFPWLPPKGPTFNIMAHASRLGTLLAERLA